VRLFVTAGAGAAGLCLVVGSVALVAEAAVPARTAHVTDTGRYSRGPGELSGQGGAPLAAGAGQRAPEVLRTFSGTGNRITTQFRVARHSSWELAWSYQCAGPAPGGRLIIMGGSGADGGVSVSADGARGQGSSWTYSDSGSHYLVVLTNCQWTAKVLGRS